jgi:hypothetical protein
LPAPTPSLPTRSRTWTRGYHPVRQRQESEAEDGPPLKCNGIYQHGGSYGNLAQSIESHTVSRDVAGSLNIAEVLWRATLFFFSFFFLFYFSLPQQPVYCFSNVASVRKLTAVELALPLTRS